MTKQTNKIYVIFKGMHEHVLELLLLSCVVSGIRVLDLTCLDMMGFWGNCNILVNL